jgi:hypothetical protein
LNFSFARTKGHIENLLLNFDDITILGRSRGKCAKRIALEILKLVKRLQRLL